MRKYSGLYEQICAWENLERAYRRARKGKRGQAPAADFERRLEDNLVLLQNDLLNQTYEPGAYHSFTIHEPKRRLISAAPFRDRVAHHALCSIIEPLFERRFIFDSYANRIGKGTHRALDRCQQFARRYPYALQMDVVQFFPSIDHALLRAALEQVVADEQTLWLCDVILASGQGVQTAEYDMVYFPRDDLFAVNRPRGLPIGNLTSQFWANVYLNELDQVARRRLGMRGYLRYVDDILLFADDAAQLREWHAQAVAFLAALRLTVHQVQAQPRPVTEGIPFLGFHVYPDHRRLKRRKVIHAWRHLKALRDQVQMRALPLADFEAVLNSWQAHAAHGDTWRLRRTLLRDVVIRYVHA